MAWMRRVVVSGVASGVASWGQCYGNSLETLKDAAVLFGLLFSSSFSSVIDQTASPITSTGATFSTSSTYCGVLSSMGICHGVCWTDDVERGREGWFRDDVVEFILADILRFFIEDCIE